MEIALEMKRVSLLLMLLSSLALCSPVEPIPFQIPDYGFVPEDTSFTRVEQQVRDATVRVWPSSFDGYGTGTYYKLGKHHFVITASHVVGETNVAWVQEKTLAVDAKIIGHVMHNDLIHDVAVILLDEPLKSRRPLTYPRHPRGERLLGAEVFYSGHPNRNDLLTIEGRVSGRLGDRLLLQSFTWFGASGANVFDHNGNLIGVLTGMDSYRDPRKGEIVDIVEDLVVATPLEPLGLSRDQIQGILSSDPPEIDLEEVLRSWDIEVEIIYADDPESSDQSPQ